MSRHVRTRHLLLAMLLSLCLGGCAALHPEPPDIQLAGLTVSDISLSHANFLATLSLYNPNSMALEVKGLEFALDLDEVQVARGKTSKEFSIPAEGQGQATVRLAISFLDLFRLAQRLKGIDAVPFSLTGAVTIGGPGFLWATVPISSQGKVPLPGAVGDILSRPDQFWRHPEQVPPGEGPTLLPAK